jgi:hypothetical protein
MGKKGVGRGDGKEKRGREIGGSGGCYLVNFVLFHQYTVHVND